MEQEAFFSGGSGTINYADEGQWQDTIQVLRMVQSDYQGVRRQLEQIDNTLAEKQNLINQRIQYTFHVSGGYQTLCLLPYVVGKQVGRIGKITLGEVAQPKVLPKPMRLQIYCFGRFEIFSMSKQVEHWQSVKAKSAFQYLVTRQGKPVAKEVLMETLWPDCNLRAASNNLKAAIHCLRNILGSLFEGNKSFPFVIFLQGSYTINPDIELWVDVDEFQQRWALGQRFDKEGKFSEAMRNYEMAEALYRGDFLEDEPYEEWTLLRREALKDTYLLILSKLADRSLENADYDSCITYSQKILAKETCREDAYRRLMCCHSRLGQRNRALRWYEICRRTMQSELDAIPDRETNVLYQRLLENESI